MSGDSLPFPLPTPALSASRTEAAKLFEELRKPLVRYLICLGLSSDEAQDVSQDAFLQLHRHVSGGGSQENIRSWLFRVAHNQARNRQTSYHQRFATSFNASQNEMPDHLTPELALLAKEKSRQLRAAIRSLTEAERECLMLRAEGLRYREIGEVLGIATSTVADSVDRAVRKLAEKCNV